MKYLLENILIKGFLLFYLVINVSFLSQANEIELIRKRLVADALIHQGFLPRTLRYTDSDMTKAAKYLHQQQEDGSWIDIDYMQDENNWQPLVALDRILTMAWEYSNPTAQLYENDKLLNGIEKAISYWYRVNPTCQNWFKNDIAKQMYQCVIAILLQDTMNEALLQKMINDLTESPSMTGANRTLLSIAVFYRGVLEKDPERIASGVKGVIQQVQISQKEGIQSDYSFHQHGPMLYNGNYGNHFLRETTWLAAIVEGTQFDFTKDEISILRDYYLQGTRWMVRNRLFDYNARGRDVGRPSGFDPKAEMLIPQLNYFMVADKEHIEEYQRSKNNIIQYEPQDVLGNKHFWRSDYTVHHRREHFTSLKMCSERTAGIETHVNSENLLGYYLPYGLTYIYRRGDEYASIFPVWDWNRLPGITSPRIIPQIKGRYTQKIDFVGGVSDGMYGVSAMELNIEKTIGYKAWFWFDKEWVALGAGIQSENESEISTGINQTLLTGNVFVDGKSFQKGDSTLHSPGWIWHDSVAYVFQNKVNIQLQVKERSGNLNRIYGLKDSLFRKNVFALWFDHGLKPKNSSYNYIVIPGIGPNKMKNFMKDIPISILANTTQIQAVTHRELGITGIVFYEAGNFVIEARNTIVTVDQPCLFLLNHHKNEVTVSDPTAKLSTLSFTISKKNGKRITKTVQLPKHENAGNSITFYN
jgi:chondroitin AC lyase